MEIAVKIRTEIRYGRTPAGISGAHSEEKMTESGCWTVWYRTHDKAISQLSPDDLDDMEHCKMWGQYHPRY